MDDYIDAVYAHPEYVNTLATSTPVSDHVFVDFELRGCPINKYQLLEVLNAYLNGRKPNIPTYSVCMECKRRGTPCVMVSQGIAVSGPGDAGRLRRPLPGLPPRLLRLLRADGDAEPGVAERMVAGAAGHERGGRAARLARLQRLRRGIPEGEQGL